ncbi:glycosyltransferase family 4 protein [Sphingomonas sediminicola]|uniref:glycosyltransferase family 4 protein n=1 Tax=Sphingomonas sediminicola TaxID=386874 RepID=UPI001FE7C1DE|nr:glycosyltransferase family 1 protein [Sphingomonas sediminicola]
MVQHKYYRGILDVDASKALFSLLSEGSDNFRGRLALGAIRRGMSTACGARRRPYLNIGHTGLNDPGFRRWVVSSDVRPIYFVHDLIPITHPEYCRAGEARRHALRMQTVLETGEGIIANSQATLDELSIFARRENLPNRPEIAAWLGSTKLPCSEPKLSARPTFVMLGTIEARKNHLLLLQVWTRLARQMGSDSPRLLVIGQRGWESEQAIDLLERGAFGDSLVEIAGCGDAELASHLASARALLFPSLAEGFGMPLIEALSAGVPVIASDLAVFREIGQGIPEFVHPLDGPAWERAILSYSEKTSVARRTQLERLSKFKPRHGRITSRRSNPGWQGSEKGISRKAFRSCFEQASSPRTR